MVEAIKKKYPILDESGQPSTYPTFASQVILADGTALEQDGVLAGGGTAKDSEKLGGKEPKYYIQPRNLLDNSDFTNPVNQRGETSYTGSAYSIDRWKTSSNVTLTVGDGFITLKNASTAGRYSVNQYIEDGFDKLAGKTITVAVCNTNGEIACASGTIPSEIPTANTDVASEGVLSDGTGAKITLETSGILNYLIMAGSGAETNLKWAALYEGEYTADNLPPYMPKGEDEEWRRCLRYYQKFDRNTLFHGPATSSSNLLAAAYTKADMRTTPSLIGTPTIASLRGGNISSTDMSVSAASVSYYSNGMVRLQLTTSGLAAKYMCEAVLIDFALSADL